MTKIRYGLASGLTLIELLVVISIMGVLVSIGLASYLSRVRYQVLQSSSVSSAEWLENVRKQAMRTNQPCTIQISVTEGELKPATTNTCGDFSVFRVSEFNQGSSVVNLCYRNIDPLSSTLGCNASTTNSSTSFVFSPRGTNSTNAVFEFYSAGRTSETCTVVFSPAGVIRHGRVTNGYCSAANG